MNESSIYSIDIKDVDEDIAIRDENINKARKIIQDTTEYITKQEIEKERLFNFKVYITEKATYNKVHSPKLKENLFGTSMSKPAIVKRGKDFGENTKFIRDFIKDRNQATTRDILNAYSQYVGLPVEQVNKNVSRTLARLKGAKEITNEVKDGGLRGGSKWRYIKDGGLEKYLN